MEISDEIKEKYKIGVEFISSMSGEHATSNGVLYADSDGYIFSDGMAIYTPGIGWSKIVGEIKDKKKSSLNFILSINKTN